MTHHINNRIILYQGFIITYLYWRVNYSKANCSSPWAYPSCLSCNREQQLTSLYFQRHAYSLLLSSLIPVHHFIWCQSIYLHCCSAKCGPESPNGKQFLTDKFSFSEPNSLSRRTTFPPNSLLIRVQDSVPGGRRRPDLRAAMCIWWGPRGTRLVPLDSEIRENDKLCRRQFTMT